MIGTQPECTLCWDHPSMPVQVLSHGILSIRITVRLPASEISLQVKVFQPAVYFKQFYKLSAFGAGRPLQLAYSPTPSCHILRPSVGWGSCLASGDIYILWGWDQHSDLAPSSWWPGFWLVPEVQALLVILLQSCKSAVVTGLEKVSFHSNPKECSNYPTSALISHTSKVMLKILQATL